VYQLYLKQCGIRTLAAIKFFARGLLFVLEAPHFPVFMNYTIALKHSHQKSSTSQELFFQALGRNFTILTYGQQDLDLEAAAQSAGWSNF